MRKDEMKQSDTKFTPPSHWSGLDELTAQYWDNQKEQEKRGQEFYDKPIETLETLEKLDSKGIDRRNFLTIMGASMAMASLSCARRPVTKIIPYVVKPENVTPGVPTLYSSTSSDGAGLIVKTREGRPIKLEGNPDHPVNRGSLSVRQQASLLNLYDTDRAKKPYQVDRISSVATPTTWQEADQTIVSEIKKARSSSKSVWLLTSPSSSPSRSKLIEEFNSVSGASSVSFDPVSQSDVTKAQEISYGVDVYPSYRFDKAQIVVSLNSDFLSDDPSSVGNAKDWAKTRRVSSRDLWMSRLVSFESVMSLTGANSDERFLVKPGDDLKVALSLLHVLSRKTSGEFASSSVRNLTADFTPEKVAHETHLEASSLSRIANELWINKGRSLVVSGSLVSKSESSLSLQIVVNAINSLLENEGKTVIADENTGWRSDFSRLEKLISELSSGKVAVLIINDVNPIYTLAKALGFEGALNKASLVVRCADRLDETAKKSDFLLPTHHYLENWGDAEVKRGLFSVQQPVIAPLHDTRSFEQSLLMWIKALGAKGLASQVLATASKDPWHEYVKAVWRTSLYSKYGRGQGFKAFWEGTLKKGVLDSRPSSSSRRFKMSALSQVKVSSSSEDLVLSLYQKETMGDGSSANNSWLQEVPDVITTVTWDNYLNISPRFAKEQSLTTNDVVRVETSSHFVEVPVWVQPGMHPEVVSLAVGYGRTAAGNVGSQVGVDAYPFARKANNTLVYSGLPVKVTKTGRRYELAATQGHFRSEGRPIVNDLSLDQFKQNPKAESVHHLREKKVQSLWPKHNYPGYRWGMAIDMNACTGCNACVVACQAENNIPTVGRKNVRVSREMHWIRIDRYFSGSEDHPEVVFQPMLCQHCENASCETVCPVLATVHSDEGLNDQAYNRCVGTRYCQNNCPYKVRRFNFFDHWKQYTDTKNLVWNPDVTVRTRGIMEKCTFCVQRIQSAKDVAKSNKQDKIKDGDLKTACQQTCPTEAIVFGDTNDPNSKVSKLQKEDHSFRVFENLNNQPQIAYLTKVRNRKDKGENHVGH